MAEKGTVMRVQIDNINTQVRSPRVAQMIRFLVHCEKRLNEIPKGQLTFNFAGRKALTYQVAENGNLNQP